METFFHRKPKRLSRERLKSLHQNNCNALELTLDFKANSDPVGENFWGMEEYYLRCANNGIDVLLKSPRTRSETANKRRKQKAKVPEAGEGGGGVEAPQPQPQQQAGSSGSTSSIGQTNQALRQDSRPSSPLSSSPNSAFSNNPSKDRSSAGLNVGSAAALLSPAALVPLLPDFVRSLRPPRLDPLGGGNTGTF